ncbi:MAG TPA: DUF3308 domain-containing protein [Bacteroidetes bacterium]|nr:DUF3308 domain-containing protein [Bacteroidota bacterium]
MAKRLISAAMLPMLMLCMMVKNAFPQENVKLAQTGMQFLSVVSDARAASLARATTTVPMGSGSLFSNPALLSDIAGWADVSASYNQWIAEIKHQTFSAAFKPFGDEYGIFGVSLQFIDYGDFYWTRVSNTASGFEDIPSGDMNKPSAFAVGVGYGKAISDAFSVGGQIRYVRQSLGTSFVPGDVAGQSVKKEYKLSVLAFDFGTNFKTGFKSLAFGMSVRNFSKEVRYESDQFQLPLVFTLGLSMETLDFFEKSSTLNSVLVSVDASHYRDHAEQVYAGLECRLMGALSLRAGYASSADEEGLTYGLGVQQYGVQVDYAYTPFGVFDNVQRVTVRFSF